MINTKEEYKNGFLIFILLGLYFLILDLVGLSDVAFLKIVNIAFILFGVNLTLRHLSAEGKNYIRMLASGLTTALIGVVLSLIGLFIYMKFVNGDTDLSAYSTTIIPTTKLSHYFLALFAEGLSSSIVVVFALMQYWKTEKTHKIDA